MGTTTRGQVGWKYSVDTPEHPLNAGNNNTNNNNNNTLPIGSVVGTGTKYRRGLLQPYWFLMRALLIPGKHVLTKNRSTKRH